MLCTSIRSVRPFLVPLEALSKRSRLSYPLIQPSVQSKAKQGGEGNLQQKHNQIYKKMETLLIPSKHAPLMTFPQR